MKKLTNLEYLQLGKFKRFLYKFANFFAAIPEKFVSFFKAIWKVIVKLGCKIKDVFKNIDFIKKFFKFKKQYQINSIN